MEASIVDLRYKTSDILQALDRNESVKVTYHGKIKGIIKPVKSTPEISITSHPFFGMHQKSFEGPHQDIGETVLEELSKLRAARDDV